MLDIKKTIEGGKALFAISGRVDSTTAPQLDKQIKESINDITELTLDLKELDYISSAGLRVLLATQKQMNQQGEMKILNVNETVMEIFEITGFSEIFTIE
ncbi:MAG: STAS domain-containing protein [Ruminococcaceae bacterium]|nr:STAS domain-containing protein [Oscillospiraceae bacterium]